MHFLGVQGCMLQPVSAARSCVQGVQRSVLGRAGMVSYLGACMALGASLVLPCVCGLLTALPKAPRRTGHLSAHPELQEQGQGRDPSGPNGKWEPSRTFFQTAGRKKPGLESLWDRDLSRLVT